MNNLKKLSALLCALAMVLALAACGGNNNSAATGDPTEVIAAANEKMAAVKSVEGTMTMDMEMTTEAGGQSAVSAMQTTGTIVQFTEPMKMKAVMEVSGTSAGTQIPVTASESYVVGAEDGTMTVYTNVPGYGWTTQTMDLSQTMNMNLQASTDIYLKNGESFVAAGEETVAGVKATRYNGVITGESFEEVMNASGMMNQLGSLGGTEGLDLAALFSDMADMPISIWIDAEGYPVRYEMDMADMMNKMFEALFAQLGGAQAGFSMTVGKAFVAVEFANFDKAADFEVPPEALAQ